MSTATMTRDAAASTQRAPDGMRQKVEEMATGSSAVGRREEFTSPWYIPDWIPAVDQQETADKIVVWAELPGVNKEDVVIDVIRNDLVIQGVRHLEALEGRHTFWLEERHSGKFRRTLSLYQPVKIEEIRATLENGVLRIELPKYPGAPLRRVTVS